MSSLRLAFMGTPDFAATILKRILKDGHEVVCVYSQPPRPAGRGKKLKPGPVHELAEQKAIEVRTPKSLKSRAEQDGFAVLDLDAAVVVAYGLILPAPIIHGTRLGCYNVHASLLPRWRGAAPIQRAIMAGDTETGISIMHMDEGLDTGPVVYEKPMPITPSDTAGALHDRLASAGASAMAHVLKKLKDGPLAETPQPSEGVTYANKIEKAEAEIQWSRPAAEIANHIRGLSPFPGAWTSVHGERLKILHAVAEEGTGAPGTVLDKAGLCIAARDGVVRVLEAQRAGKAAQTAETLLRGFKIAPGTVLGA